MKKSCKHSMAGAVLAVLLGALAVSPGALAQPGVIHNIRLAPKLPDPCTDVFTPGPILSWQIPDVGSSLRVLAVQSVLDDTAEKLNLIVIVNGNGFSQSDYSQLGMHYARNGFVVAIGVRNGGGVATDPMFVLDAIEAVRDSLALGRTAEVRIGLVGHSRGGRVVVDAAVLADELDRGYDIRAVVSLSPFSAEIESLNGTDTPAYLVLYGSQDEDLRGDLGVVSEGFGAYDKAGTEGTTTCNEPPCIANEPAFEKTMIYGYGFDHAGLVGIANSGSQLLVQDTEYISAADQLCVTKAYTTGFFRMRLLGKGVYKGLLRDEWRPLSLQMIDSFKADLLANQAGTPMQLFFQISPAQRRVINNFEGGLNGLGHTPQVMVEHNPTDVAAHAPFHVRHQTDLAFVGWPQNSSQQWVTLQVPRPSSVAATYSHLSLRMGQLNSQPAGFENPVGEDQSFLIVVQDGGGKTSVHELADLGRMPAPDPSVINPNRGLSFMTTFRIPVEELDQDGLNLEDIATIYLVFHPNTSGTILIDSVEWHRD